MKALDITGLKKTYKGGTQALKGIDLQVEEGDFFALLGPNGAGKSTTIGVIASLVNKSQGSVSVFDHSMDEDLVGAKSCIGLVPQEFNFNQFETLFQIVINQAGYYGVPRNIAKQRAEKYLKQLDLWEKRNEPARELSGGMKRRLMIARSLMHEPKMLILDEPTAGVDIELRKQLWDNVRAMNARGITILLTTHYLEEAQELCDEIAIINHGKVITCEETETLLARVENKEIRLRMSAPFGDIPTALTQKYNIEKEGRRTLMIRYAPSELEIGAVIEDIKKQGFNISDISTKESDLEDVFLQLTSM